MFTRYQRCMVTNDIQLYMYTLVCILRECDIHNYVYKVYHHKVIW